MKTQDMHLYATQLPNGKVRMERKPTSPGDEWRLLPREVEEREFLIFKEDGTVEYGKRVSVAPAVPTMQELLAAVVALKNGDTTKLDAIEQQINDIKAERG